MAAEPQRLVFQGTVNTETERALLPSGGFSGKQNLRDMNPGMKQRKGQKRQHTTTDNVQEIKNLFQYEDKGSVKYLYSQRLDGSVHAATNNPPTQTAGDFGVEVLAAVASSVTSSQAILGDKLFYTDGVRQTQVFSGTKHRIRGFFVYKGAAAIPVMPEIGEDYTQEVTDSRASRVAILDDLSTLANFDAIYVVTETPATGFNFTIGKANGNAATVVIKYWNGAYTTVGAVSDGTASGGATLAIDGTMTWTRPADEISYFQYGLSGYCYQISVSAALDAEVEIEEVTYNSEWLDVENVWDGITPDAITAKVFLDDSTKYFDYGGSGIDVSAVFGNVLDFVYFATSEPIFGLHVDCGNTPNVLSAVHTGSSDINFVADGDIIESEAAEWANKGFEPGMSIVVTGTTNNNHTWTIQRMTSYQLFVEGSNAVEDELNQSATVTFDNTSATMPAGSFGFWDGNSWEAVSNFNDGTAALSKTGFITFDRTNTAQKTDFNQGGFYVYWYRFRLDTITTNNVLIAIRYLPYFDIEDFGLGYTVSAWKNRRITSYDKFGKFIYIDTKGAPLVSNGDDFGILPVGDGRDNLIKAHTPYHNDLVVWQEEKGEKGGTTTIVEGHSPETYGIYLLSPDVGILNAKCFVLVDGLEVGTNTYTRRQQLVFWISKKGVYLSDGTSAQKISDMKDKNGGSIQNFFDPLESNSLTKGQEDKHWIAHDSAFNCLRLGLVTGSGSTECNTYPIIDLNGFAWGFDLPGQNLSCAKEISAGSGAVDIQMVGGDYSGFVNLLNTGGNDYSSNGTSVTTSGDDLAFASSTTITRTVGSFSTDGWTVGMGARISGSVSNDTSTGQVAQATTVAAQTLTFSGASFNVVAAASDIILTNEVPIDAFATMEIDGGGRKLTIDGAILRVKSQAAGSVVIDQAREANSSFDSNLQRTSTMVAAVSGDGYRRTKFMDNQQSGHFTWRFRNNTASQELYLLDVAINLGARDDY